VPLIRGLLAQLNCLVTAETPSRPLAIARIGAAAAILIEGRGSGVTLLRLAQGDVLGAPYADWGPAVTQPLAVVLIGLWAVTAGAMLLGWHTRLAGAVLTVALASVLGLDQQLYSNHLYIMFLAAGLLTLADSGAALSLDARRRGEREAVPAWPVWLLKVQVSIVYGYAALAKLNLDFLAGSVVASYLRREGPLAVPADWRFVQPMMVLALLAICAEAFIAASLWSARWRPAGLVVALGLHVFISGWLEPTDALLVFSLLMLPLLILFLDAAPGSRVLVWDDGCGFCVGWVRWFRRLDWLAVLRLVPRSQLAESGVPVSEEAALEALQLVTPRRVHSGFAAVERVAELLPIGFFWAPVLRLPPIAAVGSRIYRRVAARRLCNVPLEARAAATARRVEGR
jgi:predicted DCC family thiol-disulfide oxidoreductase YuxK